MNTATVVSQASYAPIPSKYGESACIPAELRQLPRWVLWKLETRDGKPTKVPYQINGLRADTTRPSTWTTFQQAQEGFDTQYSGIGCVIAPPYVGIDLDKCRDPQTKSVESWALDAIKALDSYTELSPSGRGYHIWVRGEIPPGNRRGPVEMYSTGRYFTVTGDHVDGTPATIQKRDLTAFHAKHIGIKDVSEQAAPRDESPSAKEWALVCNIVRELGVGASEQDVTLEFFRRAKERPKWTENASYVARTVRNAIEKTRGKGPATVTPIEPSSTKPVATRLTLTPASQIEMKALTWLWADRIPLGKATLFCGDPDIGKSLCVVDAVATVTTGRDWPDAKNEHPPAHVAMMCGEDEWEDTVKPRLFAAGADLTKVYRVNPVEVEFKGKKVQRALALDQDIEAIQELLHEHPEIRLLTFDPLASYLGDVNRNLEKEIRRILDAVKELAERTGVTILVADHFNKSLGASSIHRVAGSTSVVGAPRAVWGFVKDPENPDARIRVRIKCNVTKKRSGLRYGFGERLLNIDGKLISTPFIIWTGKSEMTADEIFARNADPEDAKLTKAVRWLQTFLADGPRPATEVYTEGARAGYDDQFLKREVKQRAGGETYQVGTKDGRRWMWKLSAAIDLTPDASGVFAAHS